MKPILFNYIITIHNKEDLIRRVLEALVSVAGDNSYIYPVLDGCTDKSESIVDEIIEEYPTFNILKIILDDVHEIRSINAALKIANQKNAGYNIILQDDVVLLEDDLESKVHGLYTEIGDSLGYVSFRQGSNVSRNFFREQRSLSIAELAESVYGHGSKNAHILLPGEFVFKDIAIKSPVCIPSWIVDEQGLLDEELAPCFHDDLEYCLRLLCNGYRNGVFAIKYESEIEWGTTRNNNKKYDDIIQRNFKYILNKYKDILDIEKTLSFNRTSIQFGSNTQNEEHTSLIAAYEDRRSRLNNYLISNYSLLRRIIVYVKSNFFKK